MSKMPILTARTQDGFIDRRNAKRAFELQRQEIVRRDMAAQARAAFVNAALCVATFATVFAAAVYFF